MITLFNSGIGSDYVEIWQPIPVYSVIQTCVHPDSTGRILKESGTHAMFTCYTCTKCPCRTFNVRNITERVNWGFGGFFWDSWPLIFMIAKVIVKKEVIKNPSVKLESVLHYALTP